jgi:succinate dehydrogenase / fumarate reductase cytochrome b subunit
MATLVTTISETLRYRGKIGQWSWVLHRIGGLGTLLFLVIHVIDTSWVYFFPELYEEAIRIYQTPLFTVGEFFLVACVVFHAFNGVRIVLFDFKPEWWKHQAMAAQIVFLATFVVLVPLFLLMGQHVVEFYTGRPFDLGTGDGHHQGGAALRRRDGPGPGGGAVLSVLVGAVTGKRGADGPQLRQRSRFDQLMWTFMRLRPADSCPWSSPPGDHARDRGRLCHNASGAAADFVAARLGLSVWRIYDAALWPWP